MGKTEAKNLDLKSKLSIVLGTIANAKKNIESFKTSLTILKVIMQCLKRSKFS